MLEKTPFARPALVLFAVALALRLFYLGELSASPLGTYLLGDGIAYDAWARRIAAGDWWGKEVFYQTSLAVLYVLFGAISSTSAWASSSHPDTRNVICAGLRRQSGPAIARKPRDSIDNSSPRCPAIRKHSMPSSAWP